MVLISLVPGQCFLYFYISGTEGVSKQFLIG